MFRRTLSNLLLLHSLALLIIVLTAWTLSYVRPTNTTPYAFLDPDNFPGFWTSANGRLTYHEAPLLSVTQFPPVPRPSEETPWANAKKGGPDFTLPYWPLALVASLSPAHRLLILVRRHRRLPRGLCPTCGYDLRATPERCPECGTVFANSSGQREDATSA